MMMLCEVVIPFTDKEAGAFREGRARFECDEVRAAYLKHCGIVEVLKAVEGETAETKKTAKKKG